jgi:ABC-type branched-subunit amino acid transport system substrate-binding protein
MSAWRRGLAALAAVTLVVAACSSDDATDEGGASATTLSSRVTTGGSWDASAVDVTADELDCQGPTANPARGVTDTSVKVGGLLTIDGPTVALFTDAEDGARARFERANAEGGVHGRTIDFVGAENDGLDPTRQVDAARKLVDEDVFAVAPLLSAITSFREVLCDARVPYFGWGFTAAWCNTTVGFAITGCIVNPEPEYTSLGGGTIGDLMADTDKTVALLGNEDEAARLGNTLLANGFEAGGLDVVYSENLLSPNVPIADPSPIVNDIMTSNEGGPPALVYMVADFANTNTMVQAMRGGGFDGISVNAVGYDPRLATAEAFQGAYTTLQWMPFEATDVPFVQQMNEDFETYIPETTKNLPAAAGYIAADLFLAGLDRAGRDLTVDSFIDALNSDWVYPTPGFKGETRYPDNHVMGVPCGTLVELQDEVYEAVVPITCSDPVKRQ